MKEKVVQTIFAVTLLLVTLKTMGFAEVSRPTEGGNVLSPAALLARHLSGVSEDATSTASALSVDGRASFRTQMTNVAVSVTQTTRLTREDVDAGVSMIKTLLSSHHVAADKDCVLYLLKAVSDIRPAATNEYARELGIAAEADVEFQRERRRRPGSISIVSRYRGPNVICIENKWRPIFDHNNHCAELRGKAIETLALAFPAMNKLMDAPDIEALIDAVRQMRGFTDDEKGKILSSYTKAPEVDARK